MSRVVGLVPARGGSKGLPGKNLRALAGKPLLTYTAEAARASGVIDRLILSTDDEAIAAAGRDAGIEVPFLRPAELAADASPMLGVAQHLLGVLEAEGDVPDWVAILQPTSPLRRPEDIRRAVELADGSGCDSVVGVTELPRHLSPDYVMRIDDEGRLRPFLAEGAGLTRRQDARAAYVRDGTIYLVRREVVLAGSLYGEDCRPLPVDPAFSLSIDDERDWDELTRRFGQVP